MKRPIAGKGLDAIIRDSRNDSVMAPAAATEGASKQSAQKLKIAEAASERQRQAFDKAVAKLNDDLRTLRKGRDDALAHEKEAQKLLQTELARLQKLINDDYPTGAARRLMVDSLASQAKAFETVDENLLDAFHLYRRIIRLDPKHIPTLYALATLYYSVDLEEKAIEVLEAIIELAPTETRARSSLAAIRGDDQ